jgi:hypothetical protein
VPGSYDAAQFGELRRFKDWAMTRGVVATFADPETFRRDFTRHLQIILRDNDYIKRQAPRNGAASISVTRPLTLAASETTQLSQHAIDLLKLAGDPKANNNSILVMRHLGGTSITAGATNIELKDNREAAKYQAAVEQIYSLGLARDVNGKRQVFELNGRGFQIADSLLGT